ncbi:MAG TPA: hypothetical protein VLA05_01125 [Coriobacteriia bacterium]|nr:hypothetical protein [Coriobacteriia bacterium]
MFDFLPTPHPLVVVALGVSAFVLTVVQMLVGYRKIHFKGRTHLKVHKALAWALLAIGLVHGFLALLYLGILR